MSRKGRGFLGLVFVALFSLWLAGVSQAGPGSVQIQTAGDITIKMGAQVRLIPTAEIDRDFGLSDDVDGAKAAEIMPVTGPRSVNSRGHLTEGAGDVKDSYFRNENRLFFNFAHAQDWDVYMALEYDTLWARESADRTDFAAGRQTQQFGIERLLATFNVPVIYSRIQAGWDARGVDIGYGGLVYGDDDPGVGIVGGMDAVKWAFWYIKKDEDEAGYTQDTTNPLGPATDAMDSDRTFIYGKVAYKLDVAEVEGFWMWDKNDQGGKNVDHHFIGLQGNGVFGPAKIQLEGVYGFGDYDAAMPIARCDSKGNCKYKDNFDMGSWAFYGDVAFDLHEQVGIKKFEVHIGGLYAQGDDDWSDDDLEGWTSAVGIMRFTPAFGSEQSISFDGDNMFGQVLYSILPAYYGSSLTGGGINGGASFENPGLIMIGGGVKAAWDKWSYKGNVMAMWFDSPEAVEYYYASKGVTGDIDISEFMGIEWNNELAYKLYKNVTIKGGAAFLFPGSGAKDITQALQAYVKGVSFDDADDSDDISMRFAAELIWFF